MNHWDQELFSRAWDFATKKHAGQTYGGHEQGMRIDYLNHIGAVVMELVWCLQHTKTSYNANLAIQCAVLHDTLEDTLTSYEEIESFFGEEVFKGVLTLTKNKKLSSKEEQMIDSLNRIMSLSPEIAMVKVADRISNLYHPPFYWDNKKIESYIKESKIIYDRLKRADALLLERLLTKISGYSKFKK